MGYGEWIARPQTDDYPDELERVIEALLSDGVDAAAGLLAPIAYPATRRRGAQRPVRVPLKAPAPGPAPQALGPISIRLAKAVVAVAPHTRPQQDRSAT